MITNNRKYITISIPQSFEDYIPKLQKTYSEIKGVSVSRGETVGIAIKNEFERESTQKTNNS